jgi:Domain of unknown function (DUF4157)
LSGGRGDNKLKVGMRSFAPKLSSSPKPVSAGAARPSVPRTASTYLNYDFGRIPVHPPAAREEQNTAAISEPSDQYEQQADRLADQVMSGNRAIDQSNRHVGSKTNDPIAASADYSSRRENVLEPEDRRFFESRFHHNFADVKIYSDREANQSALALHARAYTTGDAISFAAGEYRPRTAEGKRLLAHELAHVIQQRSIATPGTPLIQRQPADKLKETPAQQPAKPKTLKESNVDTADPVFNGTTQIVDAVLQRNQTLAPYIGDRIKKGFSVAANGKFKQDITDNEFVNAHKAAFGSEPESYTMGFYDYVNTKTIHVRPSAEFGTALHEAVHSLASPQLYTDLSLINGVSSHLVNILTEGVTAFFTDSLLNDEGLTNFNDAYVRQKEEVKTKLLKPLGFDVLANFNFKYNIIALANKLGITTKQFADFRAGAKTEVFKRLNALL